MPKTAFPMADDDNEGPLTLVCEVRRSGSQSIGLNIKGTNLKFGVGFTPVLAGNLVFWSCNFLKPSLT